MKADCERLRETNAQQTRECREMYNRIAAMRERLAAVNERLDAVADIDSDVR
jgi:hypothetical protein